MVDRRESGPMVVIGPLEFVPHRIVVPLDHARPDGGSIALFAREVRRQGAAKNLPWLVFLQGGPGFESPRPVDARGWIGFATQTHRVLLVDQRGTGNSSPVDVHRPRPASELVHFRADAIVQDCEHLRRELAGTERWSVLGQSYGGFCAVHYLSRFPAALERVYLTGGLPPLVSIEELYRRTFQSMRRRSLELHARFPELTERIDQVARRVARGDVVLPCGDRVSVPRLQQVGMELGRTGGAERLLWLFESAFARGRSDGPLTARFLRGLEESQAFDTHPFYAVLHEAIYVEERATNWAAERVRRDEPRLEWRAGEALMMTAESIHPWMFEEYGALRPFAQAAHELAAHSNWPTLIDRAALGTNTVPVAAAVYENDLYVDREFSLATAQALRGCRVWQSANHEHDGLREDGALVLGALFELLDKDPA